MPPNPRLEELVRAAQQKMSLGQLDDAAELWKRVREVAPDHPEALLRLGQHFLYRKDINTALELLKRASVAMPGEPAVQLNLAYAFRALGDTGAELKALDGALGIDPYFYPALLLKGAVFERQGNRRLAARVYKDALAAMPTSSRLAPELETRAAQAREIVRQNSEELEGYLNGLLAPMQARHPGAQLDRFEECKSAVVGTKRIFASQPTMLHFPRLPAIPFYNTDEFPWLAAIEDETDRIRDELVGLIREDAEGFRPYVNHPAGVPLNQWAELNHSPRWSAFFLWEDGKRIEPHQARCPRTAAALQSVPLCDVPGFAPAAFFSTLEPRTRIPAHTGVSNIRLIVHLPLIVPEGCGFRVGNEVREWRPGKALIFDDTIEHEAWNNSDQLRVLLIFDIWNPYLSQAEREYVSELLRGVRAYYANP
jgi:aspartate beta-hydroxylase